MDKKIGKINSNWAEREKQALRMAYKKMKSMNLIDRNLNELPREGYTKKQITEMFERYLAHFRRVMHASYEPTRIGNHISGALSHLVKGIKR